jgi:hypothetical protein
MLFGKAINKFNTMITTYLFPFLIALLGCNSNSVKPNSAIANVVLPSKIGSLKLDVDTLSKTIHVYVALCDNKYQGIVPVPAKIGNGQDPHNNLYWGCGFGIRSYFKKSKEWKFLRSQKLHQVKLERLIFKHVSKNFYLVADAYDGQYIQQCTKDFLSACAGQKKDTIQVNKMTIGIGGNAQLLSYIGHDGLMDFQLSEKFINTDNETRNCIILACVSKSYFAPHLKMAKVNPLVWSTGLMSPEAYTLHDAISGYVLNETNDAIRNRAASAYAKYQKCSLKAAKNLLVSGW